MPIYLIPVQWTECGEFVVVADSLEQAVKAVNENTDDLFTCLKD